MLRRKPRILFRKYFKIIQVFLILISLFTFLFFVLKNVKLGDKFVIKRVLVNGSFTFVNKEDFIKIAEGASIGKNILNFSTISLSQKLRNNFLAIKSININKKGFDSLIIQVQERLPAGIVLDINNQKFLVDTDGYVLGALSNSYFDLPVVISDKQIFTGQFLDQDIIPNTFEIIKQAKIAEVEVSSISYKNDYSTFYIRNSIYALIKNNKSIGEAFKIITKLMSTASSEGKKLSKVDLRYDKVIVLYD